MPLTIPVDMLAVRASASRCRCRGAAERGGEQRRGDAGGAHQDDRQVPGETAAQE